MASRSKMRALKLWISVTTSLLFAGCSAFNDCSTGHLEIKPGDTEIVKILKTKGRVHISVKSADREIGAYLRERIVQGATLGELEAEVIRSNGTCTNSEKQSVKTVSCVVTFENWILKKGLGMICGNWYRRFQTIDFTDVGGALTVSTGYRPWKRF
jgi:hypothetical protein